MRHVLRLYSIAFSALFAAVVLAMAVVVLFSKPSTVNFYLLPWAGNYLVYSLLALALLGFVILLLAWRGRMHKLFLVWSLLVLVLVVRYLFFTPHYFTPGSGEFTFAMGIVLAAILATLGAWVRPPNAAR